MEYINPDFFSKGKDEYIYKSIVMTQLARCVNLGTACEGRASLRAFERAIKMLEVIVSHRLSDEYMEKVKELINKGAECVKRNDWEGYYELLRLRLMFLIRELKHMGFMPEEKAIDVI